MESIAIPYESQLNARACGAAALCMVYRSFGLECTQAEIWRRIAQPGPWGLDRTNTRVLCADALSRGLGALVVRASEPWQTLTSGTIRGIRLILNHRVNTTKPEGHYTVLVGVDDRDAILHDPQSGPSRYLTRSELLELWRQDHGQSEISGQVLVAFSNIGTAAAECALCGAITPASVPCVNCREPIPLHASAILGCANAVCHARTWERVFCPYCDIGLYDLDGQQTNFFARRREPFSNSAE
jgi:hypothetical protein